MAMNLSGTHKKILLGAAVAVVAVIVGLLVWRLAASRVTAPEKALQALADAKSYHVATEFIVNMPLRVQGRERPFPNLLARIEGDVLRNEHGTPELTGDIYMEAKGRGEELTAEGELRILNDDVAFYLDSLPVLLNPSGSLIKKWTYVPSPLLHTYNSAALRPILGTLFASLQSQGETQFNSQRVQRFTGALTPDQAEELIDVFELEASHNHGLNTLARLLRANEVKSITVDVNDRGELAQVLVVFVQKFSDGREVDRAGVRLSFTDYHKKVTIDRPERQVTVRPEVFARIFGGGAVTPQ